MVCWVRTVRYSPCAIALPAKLQRYYICTSGKGIERHVIAGLEDPELCDNPLTKLRRMVQVSELHLGFTRFVEYSRVCLNRAFSVG
jgi:hypothetical protein